MPHLTRPSSPACFAFHCVVVATATTLLIVASARASDAPPRLPIVDVTGLASSAELLLTQVPRLQERIRFDCAITYLKYRDRPSHARSRFARILAVIDTADDLDRDDDDTEGFEDDLYSTSERLNAAEWMARCELDADASNLLATLEGEHRAARGGKSEEWFLRNVACIEAVLGREAKAREHLASLPKEVEDDDRIGAMMEVALEFRRRGDRAVAMRLAQEAATTAERAGCYDAAELRPLISDLAYYRAERQMAGLLAGMEKANVAGERILFLQVEYLQFLTAAGRRDEARAVVARLRRKFKDVDDSEFLPQALAAADDHEQAIRLIHQWKIPLEYQQREDFRRSVMSVVFQQTAFQMVRAGRHLTAKRYFREYLALRPPIESNLDDDPDYDLDRRRDVRFSDAAFALECGDGEALLRLAKAELNTDRYYGAFRCACYLATAFNAQPPHARAPINPFVTPWMFEFGRRPRL